ncbi:chromatin regulatory protein sir2 [Kalaharituber pfeilii]|nr:chromatin regulatory protein sir2 [Kalaharituber pfeilii]
MADISCKFTSNETISPDVDNVSDTDDDGSSISGFIRVSVPDASAAADNKGTDVGNDEGVEDEDEDDGGDDSGEDAWESESLYADAIENLVGENIQFGAHENVCTLEQAQHFRKRLREVGAAQFLQETVHNRSISIRKLITAFGIKPPSFFDAAPDEALLPLLHALIAREMTRRRKLEDINTIEDVVRLLKKSKNILVLTGAGISTSLGIPDFRSKDNGLYSRLAGLGLSDPQEVFDIEVFQEDPAIFYSIAKDILPTSDKFSPTHAFIELLQSKNKLLTQYTQNIDNLETRAGIRPDKLIQCHGSFATATCVKCKYKVPGEAIFPDLRAGRVAKCEMCLKRINEAKNTKKRKRAGNKGSGGREPIGSGRKQRYSEDSSAEEEEYEIQEAGVMKPDITFFGEQLPAAFHDRLVDHDRERCDLLICIGTSLKVAPPVNHVEFDVELLGSCDDVVAELCRLVGWELNHDMIPNNLKVKVELLEGTKNRYIFTRM